VSIVSPLPLLETEVCFGFLICVHLCPSVVKNSCPSCLVLCFRFPAFRFFVECVLLFFIVYLCVLRPFLIASPRPVRGAPLPGMTAFAPRHRFPLAPSLPAQPREAARRSTRPTRRRCSPHPRQYNRSPHQVGCRRDISRHFTCRGDI